MSFAPKGEHYRVSTPNLETVQNFPYTFKWVKPTDKTIFVSRVLVTLINSVEKEGTEIIFSVFSARETYSRTFRSVSDLARLCDKVSTQNIGEKHVSRFHFNIKPPIILENKNDYIELNIKKKPNLAEENYAMCQGWIYDVKEVTVKEVMHPPITLPAGISVSEAVQRMIENNVEAILVQKSGDALLGYTVGIITEQDLLEKVLNRQLDPKETSVDKVMSDPVITIDINTTLDDAVMMMIKKSIRRLPVEEKGKIVGIVTNRDLIKAIPLHYRGASKKRMFFPY